MANGKIRCNPHCAPFIIYVILGIVSIISTIMKPVEGDDPVKTKTVMVITNVVSVALFGSLFYWLCYMCYNTVAWVILLIPVVLFIFLLILAISMLGNLMGEEKKKSSDKKH